MGRILALFLVGTARCAVRAAFSGATNGVGRWTVPHCGIPPALRAATAQRAVPATTDVRTMCGCAQKEVKDLFILLAGEMRM
ncbi:MAG TPA: hypothetical protein VGJ73_05625 [Verrucomicrobiae bacterium]